VWWDENLGEREIVLSVHLQYASAVAGAFRKEAETAVKAVEEEKKATGTADGRQATPTHVKPASIPPASSEKELPPPPLPSRLLLLLLRRKRLKLPHPFFRLRTRLPCHSRGYGNSRET